MTIISAVVAASLLGSVSFVECPKCDKRMRISEDGKTAYVNLSRIDASQKEAMASRARMLLAAAKPGPLADAKRPLMGWSSWNTFAVDISDDIIVGVAAAMATNGLKDAGYVYVNIDDGYFDGHGQDGRLRFHPGRFPQGLKGTVDRIHALGMKAGAYSEAGADTCGSIWNSDNGGVGAGLYGHDDADCRLFFGELGFDFIKVDYCGAKRQKLDERKRYAEIAEAIRKTGVKGVRLNVCRWAFPGTWVVDMAGSWRTTHDIRANWKSISGIIAENLYLGAYSRPGHYNDLDMLEVGQYKGAVTSAFKTSGDTGLTQDEEVTHFGMWCMLSSPLVLGCDPRKMPPTTFKLVTNPYLLAMNQNALGLQGYVVSRDKEAYVLVKDADKRFGLSRYVALYNANDSEYAFDVKAARLDLGGSIDVFDLVLRSDIGAFSDSLSVKVPAHGSRFFRLDAERRLDRTVYEAECAFLSDYQEIKKPEEAGSAYLKQDERAEGGVCVANLGRRDSNDLIWNDVHVSASGRKKLSFKVSADGAGREFFVQIDGGGTRMLGLGAEGGSCCEVSMETELSAGLHSVRLFHPSEPMPIVDRMTVGN